ncbi:hypothetical protein QFC21_006602 [Naganishia friedmannii]|uniref:Uncharacterized protein n=1 Tax=Naganishia friedmannii TaxID=89922 RepID=A0ACC2V0N0_9TREE|nr:hypothetical protein QFC21_006602 [Naganishia friedmannii]
MPRRILVSFGVDVDAVAGWLGSYGGENSPGDISRGMFAGEVGTPRLLKLFKKYGIKTTWFIPGHSLDTFPKEMAAVRDAAHEIGLHGYSHEVRGRFSFLHGEANSNLSKNPTSMTIEQQREILEHTHAQLTEFCGGKAPVGSVAPWWEVSKEGTNMLLDFGIRYGMLLFPSSLSVLELIGIACTDHSNMAHDCQPYWLRDQDTWTKIDYKAQAKTWMKPLQRGKETGMVEIPASWDLDDLPPLIKDSANSHGFVDVRVIEQKWKDMFTYFYREEQDGFCFPITIHPDVSGRPHVLLMLERFIEWVNEHDGIEWVPMVEIEKDFRARTAVPEGAMMPKGL